MRKIVYLLTVLFLISITGCSKKSGTNSDTKKTTSGNEVSSDNKLPDSFPADFPIYKDAKIAGSTKVSGKITVTFEINDKADAVGNFYTQELPKAGYEAEKNNDKMMKNNGGIISFKKGGKIYDLTYTYKEGAGKTYLTVLER